MMGTHSSKGRPKSERGRNDGPLTIQEIVSGVGLDEAEVLGRFEVLLVERHGWSRAEPAGRALAAFDHPHWTAERSGTVSAAEGDLLRLRLFADNASLSGIPLPANDAGYSVWDLLLVESGGDRRAAEEVAGELGWTAEGVNEKWLWEQRPVLAHIQNAAHARGVSAPALLSVVLARFVAEVSPSVTLPPMIGGEMSLNIYVALLGPSGAGKTSVMAVAEDLVDWTIPQESVGSGEGFIRAYGSVRKGVWHQDRDSQFLSVDEVSTLSAQTSRSGSTLLGLLNTAWTGASLSQQYADPTKRASIPRHGYRVCLVVGVQLGKADGLLRHSDSGTPQRFIWAPLIDPDIPPPELAPKWPGQLVLPTIEVFAEGITTQMQIAKTIELGMRERVHRRTTSWERSPGDRDHDDLLQLKIAAALALLEGRMDVTEEDWSIASVIMRHARLGLRKVREDQDRRSRWAARQAGQRQGHRAVVAQDVEESLKREKAIEQAARRIANHVHQHAPTRERGYCVKKCAKNGLSQAGLLKHFDEAVSFAVDSGWIVSQSDVNKSLLIPGPVPPQGGTG